MSSINITSHHCSCNLSHRYYFDTKRRFHSMNKMNNIITNVSFCGQYYCSYFATTTSTSGSIVWKLRDRLIFSTSCALDDTIPPDDSEDGANINDDDDEKESESTKANSEQDGNYSQEINNGRIRENLERIIGTDDSTFSGIDLATLIRNKYGRSYDVQLIKKEFMGRNLLAMNVMWKYMEQRSFPLTEEEYILRLDDVANNLKCWGAVSHIRTSLQKSKERPRIGKAVSIFIDMDESGGRANEWIYK